MIDFRLGPGSAEVGERIRAFCAEHVTIELVEQVYRTGVSHDSEFTRALAEAGWLAPGWPVEYGGQGLDPIEMLTVAEELRIADAPTYGIGTTLMVASVIRAVGTQAQKDEILPKALSGEVVIVLGFSEPEAGSDVAAIQTKAVADGDEWVINGQKMFTTNGHIGDYVFLLTRTDPGGSRHGGMTMFLVPMHQPGIDVQPVFTMSGERTNITFYNDVRVSDAWRIGEVDHGWATMTVALTTEHSSGFAAQIDRLLSAAEEWAGSARDDNDASRLEDGQVRATLAWTAIDLEVSRLLQHRTAWIAEAGLPMTTEGPMAKLFSSEALSQRAQEIVELVGPDAVRSYFDPTAPVNGEVEHMLRHSIGTTIYAGTSEMHRNMIAHRGLGLPRSR